MWRDCQVPFYPDQRTLVLWYFCRFLALPSNGSQHQPTQCKSTVLRKQHHQAQSQGAISFKQRKPSLNMDEGLDLIPPVNNPLLGIHNFSVTQQDKPLNNDEVRVIRTKYWFHFNFSLWVLEFSVLDYYSVMCGIQDFLVSLTFCAFWPVRHRVMESL